MIHACYINEDDASYTVRIKSPDGFHQVEFYAHRYLNRLLRIKMQRADCYVNNCMMFVGPDLLRC